MKETKDFYINIEEKEKSKEDDYNFDLDYNTKLNDIVDAYHNTILKEIKNKKEIKKYKACLIKPEYHIQGNIFLINNDIKDIIYFFRTDYDFYENKKNASTCNNMEENNDANKLCYGSAFKCPEKEKFKKIKIDIKDIRMIIKRIYFYRKSAIEIFTETKSYYFNFYSKKELDIS
jgi:hypothetical protein